MGWDSFFDAELRRADEPGFAPPGPAGELGRLVLAALPRPTGGLSAWTACRSTVGRLGRALTLVERAPREPSIRGALEVFTLGANVLVRASRSSAVRRWIRGLGASGTPSEVVEDVLEGLALLPYLYVLRERPAWLVLFVGDQRPTVATRRVVDTLALGAGDADLIGSGGSAIERALSTPTLCDAFASRSGAACDGGGASTANWKIVLAWLSVYGSAATPTSLRALSDLCFRWGVLGFEGPSALIEALVVAVTLDPTNHRAADLLAAWLDPSQAVGGWSEADRFYAYETHAELMKSGLEEVHVRRDRVVARALADEMGGDPAEWQAFARRWFDTLIAESSGAPDADTMWVDELETSNPLLAARYRQSGWPCPDVSRVSHRSVTSDSPLSTTALWWSAELASSRHLVRKLVVAACCLLLAAVIWQRAATERAIARRDATYQRLVASIPRGGDDAFAAATAYRELARASADVRIADDARAMGATAIACEIARRRFAAFELDGEVAIETMEALGEPGVCDDWRGATDASDALRGAAHDILAAAAIRVAPEERAGVAAEWIRRCDAAGWACSENGDGE